MPPSPQFLKISICNLPIKNFFFNINIKFLICTFIKFRVTWNVNTFSWKIGEIWPNADNPCHTVSPGNYHHHHHVVPLAQISLTLSRHFSLSFIASGRSSALYPVSSQSCCMYVRAGRPAFARPYVGVHRITSLMSSSLLLQQCLACVVRLTWIVFLMGGKWSYSWCFVGFCLQDLFNIARSILV